MNTLLIRLVINALALWVAQLLIDGIELTGSSTLGKVVTLIVVALIFGLLNTLIKPILRLFTLPLFVLTLGLITFVINALMLWLTGGIASALNVNFSVEGFWSALWGSLVISIVSWILSLLLRD
jgi:putative membrane protein